MTLFQAILAVAASLILFTCCGGNGQKVTPNPQGNVLLITMDTTRADRLGSSGYAAARTPNLDCLAASGVSFENAYSPVPLTLPAHCTIFSGMFPPGHKVRNNGNYSLPGRWPRWRRFWAGAAIRHRPSSPLSSGLPLRPRPGIHRV